MKKEKKRIKKKIIVPKNCYFDKEEKEPWFTDTEVLSRFLTERKKLIGRSRSGVCSKHQRALTIAVKRARHLALLPFVAES